MQQQPKPTSSIKLGSPRGKISKDRLEHLVQNQSLMLAQTRERNGPSVTQVQMSIRIPDADHLGFRALCMAMCKTNGKMLSELIQVYLAQTAQ